MRFSAESILAMSLRWLDAPVGFARGPVGEIGLLNRPVGERRHRLARFLDDVFLPAEQFAAEICQLLRVHELFVGAGTIAAGEMRIQSVTMKRSHYPSTPRSRIRWE
jgi:hypothetical protein